MVYSEREKVISVAEHRVYQLKDFGGPDKILVELQYLVNFRSGSDLTGYSVQLFEKKC